MRKTNICAALVMCSLVHGCGLNNKVQLSGSQQNRLTEQKSFYNDRTDSRAAASPEKLPGTNDRCVDYAVETEVSEKSVAAWRVALGGDVDKAMKQLDVLDKKYPGLKTVSLMKAQIQQHAGNKEEAIKYYKQANVGDEFDSVRIFKLAELERQSGKNAEAIESYHKLLAGAPTFAPGQLGLAKAILVKDSRSAEARKNLQALVEADPEKNEPTTKEAQLLLKQMKAGEQ